MEKLRAGLEIENVPHDLSVILGDSESDGGIKDGKLLIEFAEAIVSRDAQSLSAARDKIVATMGLESLVDAAAVAGAFQGLDRIANGTGIPIEKAKARMTKDLREELGLNKFSTAILPDDWEEDTNGEALDWGPATHAET